MTSPSDSPSDHFDWKAIRERFDKLLEAANRAEDLTPEQAEAVMAERARTLAQVPSEPPDTSEILELMILQLGSERFAIETQFIREVYVVGDITPVPGAPPFLVGVTNLRGEVLAVMDLRSFFGVSEERTEKARVIVLGTSRAEFGVLVDAVHEVTTLRIDEVLASPGSVAGVSREYLRGLTQEALLILDGRVLLEDEQLCMNESDTEHRGD